MRRLLELHPLISPDGQDICRRVLARVRLITHLLRRHPGLIPLLTITLISLCGVARAQGGPPFKTDDPETPGNKHWEINFGWLGERSAGEGSYSVPDVDLNYGLGDRIQLKFELPIVIYEIRNSLGKPGRSRRLRKRDSNLALANRCWGSSGDSMSIVRDPQEY